MYENKWTEGEDKMNIENHKGMNRETGESQREAEEQKPLTGQRRQVYGLSGQAVSGSQTGQNARNGAGYSSYDQYAQGHPGYGYYNYSQGNQNQNHAPNSYTNPYQYGQNQNPGQSMTPDDKHKTPKKRSYMKTGALVTAAVF